MSDFLKRAEEAVQLENWSLLNQYLQQLSFSDGNAITYQGAESREVIPPEQTLALALEVLEAGDFQARWDVAKVFPKLGTVAIASLVEILEDEEADLELRWFAARILGEFNHPEVVMALVEVLKTADQDEDLSSMAATALASLGPLAIAALTDLLAEESSRLLAVRSLAQIRRVETIAPLLSVVHDPQVSVRATAIEALSSFHDARIPPVLIAALDDLAAAVRREAVIGLGLRTDLLNELDLVQLLQPRLRDFNLEVCQQAAIALGRVGSDAAATALLEVLQSPHTPISLQLEGVRALSWIGTPLALTYLQQALMLATLPDHSLVAVSQEIVTLLGRVEPPALKPQAVEILMELLNSEHPVLQSSGGKQAIALSLGQLGDQQALETLIQLLADPDVGVRLHAIAALKNLAPEAARQRLESLLQDKNLTPALEQGVAIALQEWQS
jgi:HEAT repeat protein